MTKILLNDDWTVRRKISGFVDLMGGAASKKVTLPHDAMIEFDRSADASGGASSGFFPGGEVEYTKSFHVPLAWREQRVTIEFDGVYRDAMVYVNDEFAGQWRYGYSVFRVSLDAHLRYFTRTQAARGEAWSDDLEVVFERFSVVWPPEVADRL